MEDELKKLKFNVKEYIDKLFSQVESVIGIKYLLQYTKDRRKRETIMKNIAKKTYQRYNLMAVIAVKIKEVS